MMYRIDIYSGDNSVNRIFDANARIQWCEEHFGTQATGGNKWIKGHRWWFTKGWLEFSNEQDYLFYLLRWGT